MLLTSSPADVAHPAAHSVRQCPAAERPEAAPGLPADTQAVVRSVLRGSSDSSSSQRRLAQDLAWRWVGAKWPRLLAGVTDTQAAQVHVRLPNAELLVQTSANAQTWVLQVAHRERDGARTWRTQAQVARSGAADLLSVLTSCSALHEGPRAVAPPGVLGLWVDRLALDDGGFAVLSQAREVTDHSHLAAFLEHLLSPVRRLPIIALSHQPHSRYYGVDPAGLAEAVRGLAHVACVSPAIVAAVAQRFGPALAPVAGAARVYAPGLSLPLDAATAQALHPLWLDPRPAGHPRNAEPGAFRRSLCRRLCAWSVAGSVPVLQ